MSRLSDSAWKSLLQTHSQSRAVERRGLRHLHDPRTLDELSIHLASHLAGLNIQAVVRTESVWVDGTPQVKAATKSGNVQCELADLLVLLSVTRNNKVERCSAVLIQAKVGIDFNRIPGGSSTKKERALLEELDHSKKMEVYRDMQGKSQIGSYQLKTSGFGLGDYSRYMVMPTKFDRVFFQYFQPFVTGWPKKINSNLLSSLTLFKDTSIALWDETLGSQLRTGSACEWTRLVEDLLGQYRPKRMKRFGGFDRIKKSSECASFMINTSHLTAQRHLAWTSAQMNAGEDPPNNLNIAGDASEPGGPAALPIVSFVVDLTEHD